MRINKVDVVNDFDIIVNAVDVVNNSDIVDALM